MLRILKLTLKKLPFEVMKTGEKNEEYREPTDWIRSRLFNKDGSKKQYDFIEFRNGYGKNKPHFVSEFIGFEELNQSEFKKYSNGLCVFATPGCFKIYCGKIVPWTNHKY